MLALEGGAPPYKGGTRGRRTYYIKARSGANLPPKRLNAFAPWTGLLHLSGGKRMLLEAILVPREEREAPSGKVEN